jgi:hypothetical protein
MDQVSVAVKAFLLIAGSGIEDRSVGQHGPPFVRDVEEVLVTLLAISILNALVSYPSVPFPIVFVQGEVEDQILHSVVGLEIVESNGV